MRAGSIKIQIVIFLSAYAVFLAFTGSDIVFLYSILTAVLCAVGVEMIADWLTKRQPAVRASTCITGLIIGFVLGGTPAVWVPGCASIMAVASKFVFRFKKKHIFNPAAFGIVCGMMLCGATAQWKGTYVWQVLAPCGFYALYRVRKIEVLCGYTLATVVLFGIQAKVHGVPVSAIFGYLSYFFIFVMLIEPKTTPVYPLGKFIFGIGVAGIIFIGTNIGVRFDIELSALLVGNATVPLLNSLKKKGGKAV